MIINEAYGTHARQKSPLFSKIAEIFQQLSILLQHTFAELLPVFEFADTTAVDVFVAFDRFTTQINYLMKD
jgi:hypothetical protein